MKARGLIVEKLGDWREVAEGTLEIPHVGPDDVLVAVEAASLNFPDLLLIEGKYQVRPDTPFIPGRDAAGTVSAFGENVRHLKVGDRVAAQAVQGAFADHLVVSSARVSRLPDSISFAAGAAAATVFATAHVALDIRGKIQPGERVLVTGAAGGVGTAMLHLTRHRGGVPIALVSSEEKAKFARSNGAEVVIRSDEISDPRNGLRQALKDKNIDGVDIVADVVGGDVFDASLRVLRPEGRLLVIGFTSGRIPEMQANYALLKNIAIVGSPLEFYLSEGGLRVMEALEKIFTEIPATSIEALVTATYPLSAFQTAAQRLIAREALGKQVLTLK